MIVWKELFWWDGHLISALQRAETSVIDGAIRDNFAIRG